MPFVDATPHSSLKEHDDNDSEEDRVPEMSDATSPPRQSVEDSDGAFGLSEHLVLRHSRVQEEALRTRAGGSSIDFLAHLQPESPHLQTTSPGELHTPQLRVQSETADDGAEGGILRTPEEVSEAKTTLVLEPLESSQPSSDDVDAETEPEPPSPRKTRASVMGKQITPQTMSISKLLVAPSQPVSPKDLRSVSNDSTSTSASKGTKSRIPRLSMRGSPAPASPQPSGEFSCITAMLACAHAHPHTRTRPRTSSHVTLT